MFFLLIPNAVFERKMVAEKIFRFNKDKKLSTF